MCYPSIDPFDQRREFSSHVSSSESGEWNSSFPHHMDQDLGEGMILQKKEMLWEAKKKEYQLSSTDATLVKMTQRLPDNYFDVFYP